MNKTQLFSKFNEAIRWNSFIFIIGKVNKTLITFLLFYKLPANEFSSWANITSIIFILALWADFGFSKSLPLYCIKFAKNTKLKKIFIKKIIIFKIAISLLTNIIFLIFSPKLIQLLGLSYNTSYFYLGSLLFFTESTKSVIRILFHSYFWQKTFNSIESIIITLQTFFTILILSKSSYSNYLVSNLFIIEIVSGAVLIAISLTILKNLEKDKDYQGEEALNEKKLTKEFINHSLIMWGFVGINSLTERNFLLPFLTFTLGQTIANIFKVANDFALLFQRFIIKTLGTTPTSILAHAENYNLKADSNKNVFKEVFIKLNKQIINLTMPLLGILVITYNLIDKKDKLASFYKLEIFSSYFLFKVFIFLTIIYLSQILFIAYDRLLEVKRDYKELYKSFIPYIFIIIFFILGIVFKDPFHIHLSLISTLLIINGLKICSTAIRIYYSYKKYKIAFPLKYFILYSSLTFAIAQLISFLLEVITV
ncbi:TPA: hypothetical protein DEO28_03790 [Candidatus Dependentiae bacterium]|nr:MAG: hypothetical protein UR14_C0007G0059 [candidate division TM6 bacterium GW2011_GWE2_31_21]KKP53580.1 MAG: hypothetical protein UR43_C0004G0121 [candidate division TM6 bacterium GW2011_GWF2_33_332]HBS48180.1 hypothetical protein [Candidatus Dependentiae bacterium]HBZ73604.1 hypothetical protein [Candidatus Dependentiae bacterium]